MSEWAPRPPDGSRELQQWLWFHLASMPFTIGGEVDVQLVISPPPTLALQAALGRRLGGPPYVFAVWEAYPDVLFSMGIVREHGRAGRMLRSIEGLIYRRASHVMFLTDQAPQ